MRLCEIESQVNFDTVWNEHIVHECSDILDLYKNSSHFFYRGFADQVPNIFSSVPRGDRLPKDSLLWLSQLFDYGLVKMGFKALRSNSIFVTSSHGTAKIYGDTYIIFPVNGFDYTWTNSRDLVLSSGEARMILDPDMYQTLRNYPEQMEIWSRPKTLEQLILLLQDFYKGQITINKDDMLDLDNFKHNMSPSKTDLQKPLESPREVCIRGKYYALASQYASRIETYMRLI